MKTSQEPLRWQDGVSDARLVKIGVVLFILSAFAARLLGELFLEGIVSPAAFRFGSVAVMLLSLIVTIASGLPATWVVDPRRRVLELHRYGGLSVRSVADFHEIRGIELVSEGGLHGWRIQLASGKSVAAGGTTNLPEAEALLRRMREWLGQAPAAQKTPAAALSLNLSGPGPLDGQGATPLVAVEAGPVAVLRLKTRRAGSWVTGLAAIAAGFFPLVCGLFVLRAGLEIFGLVLAAFLIGVGGTVVGSGVSLIHRARRPDLVLQVTARELGVGDLRIPLESIRELSVGSEAVVDAGLDTGKRAFLAIQADRYYQIGDLSGDEAAQLKQALTQAIRERRGNS